jgi:hypothetical protein
MLVVASAALALWGGLIAPLAVRSMDAWVAFLTGAFLVLVATRPGRMWDHALVAALVASLAFAAGLKALHIAPAAVSYSAERIVAQATQPYLSLFPESAAALGTFARAFALLYPSQVVLTGLVGLGVAWRWHHIIASTPIGEPPGPVSAFRFSDHFVWALLLGLGAMVAQAAGLLPAGASWPVNLLAVMGGLYMGRGWAVALPGLKRLPPPLLLVIGFAVLFLLLPFALAALMGLGVADTWVDFRRRPAPAEGA